MRLKSLILLVPLGLACGCCDCATKQAAVPSDSTNASANAGRYDAGHPVIVRMAGRTSSLTISATEKGPAYSVADPAGRALLSAGTLADLQRVNPELARQVQTGLATVESSGRGEFLDASIDAR
jgi:hypothetical protein